MNVSDRFFEYFPVRSRTQVLLFTFFSRYKWYRRSYGGLWQRFNAGNPRRPYLIWLELKKPLTIAIETEDYRPKREDEQLEFHGCLTGDCPHEKQSECDESLRNHAEESK